MVAAAAAAAGLTAPAARLRLQVVGVRLAKHVLKHQDKLIAGVTNVTSVQDDLSVRMPGRQCTLACRHATMPRLALRLHACAGSTGLRLMLPHCCLPDACTPLQAAHVICRGSRAQLRLAAEDVQHQIRVITCTRRKQASMQALEAAGRIKRVKDLHVALR